MSTTMTIIALKYLMLPGHARGYGRYPRILPAVSTPMRTLSIISVLSAIPPLAGVLTVITERLAREFFPVCKEMLFFLQTALVPCSQDTATGSFRGNGFAALLYKQLTIIVNQPPVVPIS